MSILVIGSLNTDRTFYIARAPEGGETLTADRAALAAGGKGANQAAAAARAAGGGVPVRMLGCVGDDGDGEMLRSTLAQSGVETESVRVLQEAPTGSAFIVVEATGENRIIILPGANAALTPDDIQAAAFGDAEIVLLQLEVPMPTVEAAAARARNEGRRVLLDPAPAVPLSRELLACVDVLTPNRSELTTLLGLPPLNAEAGLEEVADLARKLLAEGVQIVVVKLGADGALCVTAEGTEYWPPFRVDHVVDTTAAGDVWNGSFAAALTEGKPLGEAGRFACTAAALCVTRAGAIPSIPHREDVEKALLS